MSQVFCGLIPVSGTDLNKKNTLITRLIPRAIRYIIIIGQTLSFHTW